tara:strand:- start:226 stop:819 length:594 start_codon:yes stop_codon:yes gene_type:complete
MFALVESNKVTKILNGNKGITIGDNQYPAAIFTVWTEAERNAIGIYTVQVDKTNFKSTEYYTNTMETYSFSDSKVKSTYGTATAKSLDDVLFTQADEDAGRGTKGELNYRGLKYIHKEAINNQCAGILAPSDWMYIKAGEEGTTMDSGWKTWRASVRTKCNAMQTAIDNASDVDALAALYVRNDSGVRPLGDFPVKE